MRRTYVKPYMQIELFDIEDVIVTSPPEQQTGTGEPIQEPIGGGGGTGLDSIG